MSQLIDSELGVKVITTGFSYSEIINSSVNFQSVGLKSLIFAGFINYPVLKGGVIQNPYKQRALAQND